MSLTQYSPDDVVFSIAGAIASFDVNGYAEGTFIEIERDEDGWTNYAGALGDICRVRNLNKMGKITVTLMTTAPINSALASLAITDEDQMTGVVSVQVKDNSGDMLCDGAEAWILKHPKIERSKEATTVQWVFVVAELQVYAGGNT
jgi:Protein of unknown function (DUF3277)